MLSWRAATGWSSTEARISTPSPYSASQGARMNTARTLPSIPGISRSSSKDRIWRPNALRSHSVSISPRCSRSSMIIPAQVPSTGLPPRTNSRSGSASPSRLMPSVIVVDSPPGITSPSSPSRSRGTRTSRGSAPSSRRSRPWASKSPCSARTPTTGATALPAPVGEELLLLELARLQRGHGRAEALGRAGDPVGVLEVRGRLDDRLGARRGILGLEDAGADEVALGAELHHQRGVGRGRDAAGAEQDDRQLAGLGHAAHEVEWRLQLLGGGGELGVVERGDPLDLAGDLAHVAHGLDDVARPGLALE